MKIRISGWLIVVLASLFLVGCSRSNQNMAFEPSQMDDSGIKTLEASSDAANGEKIYFTATDQKGNRIRYEGGPNFGGMMAGTFLSCAACHGPEAGGGQHFMHMQTMDAPAIHYAALAHQEEDSQDTHTETEYSLEDFKNAVVVGKHPDGDVLSVSMPRWRMNDQDLADLFAFLKQIAE